MVAIAKKTRTSSDYVVWGLFWLVILSLPAAGAYWYWNRTYSSDCGSKPVAAAEERLRGVAEQWDDASAVASATSRIALSEPVTSLQAIRRQTRTVEVPTCLGTAKEHLLSMMDATILGYLAFMAQDEAEAQNQLLTAKAAADQLQSELQRVASCAPDCE